MSDLEQVTRDDLKPAEEWLREYKETPVFKDAIEANAWFIAWIRRIQRNALQRRAPGEAWRPTDDKAREHAICLYNELHGIPFARVHSANKGIAQHRIELIVKALRTFAFPIQAAVPQSPHECNGCPL